MHLKLKTKLNSVCNTQVKLAQFVSYTEQTFPADVPFYNHSIFKVGKNPQKDGVQPILQRCLTRDLYMNAWRRVKLLHFPVHARYKIPNVSQAHAASSTGDSLLFPRNHRAFPPAWPGSYVLPSTNSLCSFPIPLFAPGIPGLSGHSTLGQWLPF